jgi:hypothetical protein
MLVSRVMEISVFLSCCPFKLMDPRGSPGISLEGGERLCDGWLTAKGPGMAKRKKEVAVSA